MTGNSPLAPHAASPKELVQRQTAERTGWPFLVLRDGDGTQRLVVLEPEPSRRVIGRRTACEVALPWDGEVSRAHAVLERLGDEWTVADDGLSGNGTWIEGERVRSPRVLRDGDVIVVGVTMIGFRRPVVSPTAIATIGQAREEITVSPAQRAVLVALCRPVLAESAGAASNGRIAEELQLGVETVKSHLKALYQRFGLDDVAAGEKRSALAHAAVRSGTVGVRDVA